ncbi:hypothetical protein ABK040_004825 [Willaertia magna]
MISIDPIVFRPPSPPSYSMTEIEGSNNQTNNNHVKGNLTTLLSSTSTSDLYNNDEEHKLNVSTTQQTSNSTILSIMSSNCEEEEIKVKSKRQNYLYNPLLFQMDTKTIFYINTHFLKNLQPFDNFLNDDNELQQELSCFFCRYQNAVTTILYSHGNAEDIGQLKKWMIYLSRTLQCNTMCYDYQGYGCSNNEPSEKHFFSDIRLAFKYLTDHLNIPSNEIILFGRSIGTGPTSDIVKELVEKQIPIKGVILQSPLLSAIKTKFNLFTVPDFLITDMMKNEDKFQSICHLPFLKNIPILIFHGKKDLVVPFEHGETLFRIISSKFMANEKYLARFINLLEAGHNNCESLYLNEMIDEMDKFIVNRNEENLMIEGSYITKPIKELIEK